MNWKNFFTDFTINFTQDVVILFSLLVILSIISIRLLFSKNLFDSIIMLSLFSMLISACYLLMDAPDVSMTEVALGACFSTAVLLNMAKFTGERYNPPTKTRIFFSLLLCFLFVGIMVFANLDLPAYGDMNSPLHQGVSEYYIQNTKNEIGINSIVAAVLASYRGFDTLGEAGVILIAGLGVILILNKKGSKNV